VLPATLMPSTIFEAVPGSAGGVVKSSVMVFASRVIPSRENERHS
jgi:hypothetical protein